MKIDKSVVRAILARTLIHPTLSRLQEIATEVTDGLNKALVVQDQLELLRMERAEVVAEHAEVIKAIDDRMAKVQSVCEHACTSDRFSGFRRQHIVTECEICGKTLGLRGGDDA